MRIRTLQIGARIAVGIAMTLLLCRMYHHARQRPLISADVQRAKEGIEPAALPYALVKLTPEVVNILGQHIPRLSTAFAAQTPPKSFRFGIGDIVSVSIFEAAAGGLFTSDAGVRAGNFVTIPNQAVDEQGNISVPYAGAIRARGRTPFEISKEITDKLQARALEPQVVVSLATQNTSLITVLGDVRSAGRFPASPAGERVLDAIARAGGTSAQGYDTWVSLKRMGHRQACRLARSCMSPPMTFMYSPTMSSTCTTCRRPSSGLALEGPKACSSLMLGACRWPRQSENKVD